LDAVGKRVAIDEIREATAFTAFKHGASKADDDARNFGGDGADKTKEKAGKSDCCAGDVFTVDCVVGDDVAGYHRTNPDL
jgi:hypothetical protein